MEKVKPGYAALIAMAAAIFVAACQAFDPSVYNEAFRRAAETKQCFVHHLPLRPVRAPIGFGYVLELEGDPGEETRIRSFPFATWHVDGGCVLDPDGPSTVEVLLCAKCEAAKLDWIAWYPDRPWSVLQRKRFEQLRASVGPL